MGYSDALVFVGKNVASGALNKFGSEVAGFVLGDIFGDSSKEILDAIQQLGQQLTQIQNSIAALEDHLAEMKKEILQKLEEIEQKILYDIWAAKDNLIQDSIAIIETQYHRFVEFANNPTITSKQDIAALVTQILDTNNGAEVQLRKINSNVIGAGDNKGVLQLWAEMMIPLINHNKIHYGQAIDNYITYYTKIACAQIRAANLLVEAFNQKKQQPIAKESWITYRNFMTHQEIPFIVNVDKFIYYAMQKNVTWFDKPDASGKIMKCYTYSYFTASMSYLASAHWDAYYRPTYEHELVERILANAQAMGPDERRIALWMIYPSLNREYQLDLVKNTNIQIVVAANPQEPGINPTRTELIPVFTDPHITPHYIKRFIYSDGVKDGAFVMKDKNGQDGLVPQEGTGSMQKTVYFQGDQYLAYNLNVTPVTQFDFMDFAAYYDVFTYAMIER